MGICKGERLRQRGIMISSVVFLAANDGEKHNKTRSWWLFAPSSSTNSTFSDNRLTDASLNGCQFSLRSLNDRPFEPDTGTGEPPDRYNYQHTQHYHRRVVEGEGCNRNGSWQHKQHGDEDNP